MKEIHVPVGTSLAQAILNVTSTANFTQADVFFIFNDICVPVHRDASYDEINSLYSNLLEIYRIRAYQASNPELTNDDFNKFIESTSVLPMRISEDITNILEVLVCNSVAGDRDAINGMPGKLSLIRKLKSGKEVRGDYYHSAYNR